MEWGGTSRGPKERGWGEKVLPVMQGGTEMEQDKTMRDGDEDPILRPRPAPLLSLVKTLMEVAHDIHVNSKKKKKNTIPIFIFFYFFEIKK